ncbi:MAG: DNA-methyltransferase [Promethearchaeota archaeon]
MSLEKILKTTHKIYYKSSKLMEEIQDNSIALVVTSPPYPMIEMWDNIFALQNPDIKDALDRGDAYSAFELMHAELDRVWKEVYRVLVPGGFLCINIGDATRTIENNFQLFPSHARIINSCLKIGFQSLPEILWRKQTNSPTKFMGSGMLPPGAYITLEHEHILIFRKGKKREFNTKELKELRRESAYFWEERNEWFSDIWTFKGIPQQLSNNTLRKKSAAYPFELAYRLINMFSIKNDIVLDPFLGTGTTTIASMVSMRNSIGYEIDKELAQLIEERIKGVIKFGNKYIKERIRSHQENIKKLVANKGPTKYISKYYGFRVMTNQEQMIKFHALDSFKKIDINKFEIYYKKFDFKLNDIERKGRIENYF